MMPVSDGDFRRDHRTSPGMARVRSGQAPTKCFAMVAGGASLKFVTC
jgi:hypothetical protein